LSDVEELTAAVRHHQLSIAEEYLEPLHAYAQLLWDWNTRLNLTRHTDIEAFVTRDLTDTLQLLPFLRNGSSVVDVGSGGGVPGVLLAILRPDLTVTLVESVARKVDALRAMIEALQLNSTVVNDRAESHLLTHSYDILTARAVAALPKLLTWFRPPLRQKHLTQALFIKGPRWTTEWHEARRRRLCDGVNITELATWSTVGRDGESVLLELRQARS
jgi:16S rRNA (guanine527-N7)-methyltransferase